MDTFFHLPSTSSPPLTPSSAANLGLGMRCHPLATAAPHRVAKLLLAYTSVTMRDCGVYSRLARWMSRDYDHSEVREEVSCTYTYSNPITVLPAEYTYCAVSRPLIAFKSSFSLSAARFLALDCLMILSAVGSEDHSCRLKTMSHRAGAGKSYMQVLKCISSSRPATLEHLSCAGATCECSCARGPQRSEAPLVFHESSVLKSATVQYLSERPNQGDAVLSTRLGTSVPVYGRLLNLTVTWPHILLSQLL